MRLSVTTEGVSIRAEADGAASVSASGEAPAASSNGAAPEQEVGIRGLIRSLSGKLAGGNGSNGAAKSGPGAVEKVGVFCAWCPRVDVTGRTGMHKCDSGPMPLPLMCVGLCAFARCSFILLLSRAYFPNALSA